PWAGGGGGARPGRPAAPVPRRGGGPLTAPTPPLGRRVHADPAMLSAFVAHAARVLRPGGRLAWISPFAQRTVAAARAARLTAHLRRDVDLGGFTAELQVLTRSPST